MCQTVMWKWKWEDKCGQWLFICYSPAKDCVSVLGMEDWSPEELRLEAYQAKPANFVDQYSARVKGLLEEYQVVLPSPLSPLGSPG